jgi:cell division protein FtsI (penicillin-binding protein 3)
MGNRDQTSRLVIVVAALLFGTALIIWRLAWIQFGLHDDYAQSADEYLHGWVEDVPARGYIYDNSGTVVLAAPGSDYELGLDIPLTFYRYEDGTTEQVKIDDILYEVSRIIGVPFKDLQNKVDEDKPYAHLSNRITPQQAEEIKALGFPGLAYHPIPTRLYPQKNLLCHAIGYVDGDGTGGMGLEGNYQRELTGDAMAEPVINLPSAPLSFASATPSFDLVLTIDRNVQATVERHLQQAIATYGAEGGTIIAMNPQTGAILAMASTPCFDPKEYGSVEEIGILANPAISRLYEPGSVMKLITIAAAIDSGAVGTESIYSDSGVRVTGGIAIRNADEVAYGPINMAQTLEYSVNTATAWAAETMGADTFYAYLDRFGFGRVTEVDLAHEGRGIVAKPGMENWSPAALATNAFGQGFATTPLQMLVSIAAIANEGKMMRPYLVQEMRRGDEVIVTQPQELGLTVSAETARLINSWAIKSGHYAEMEEYTVAGKTGTAQIPVSQGDGVGFYHQDDVIASFVGWLPADDPQLAMIVKLDKITTVEWGSESAAPAFAALAKELVILLDIPPDSVRLATTP